jgi:hypothetical protein
LHIREQAGDAGALIGIQKILGRWECYCAIAQRPYETRQSLPNLPIVVDDRYAGFFSQVMFLTFIKERYFQGTRVRIGTLNPPELTEAL